MFSLFSGWRRLSSVWIFGEGNDCETNLLRVASHEDLTNLYSILQCNPTHRENENLKLSQGRFLHDGYVFILRRLTSSKVSSEVFPWTMGKGFRPSRFTKITAKLKLPSTMWQIQQNVFYIIDSPSSYSCPPTFTKAIKCRLTFSSKLGACDRQEINTSIELNAFF